MGHHPTYHSNLQLHYFQFKIFILQKYIPVLQFHCTCIPLYCPANWCQASGWNPEVWRLVQQESPFRLRNCWKKFTSQTTIKTKLHLETLIVSAFIRYCYYCCEIINLYNTSRCHKIMQQKLKILVSNFPSLTFTFSDQKQL